MLSNESSNSVFGDIVLPSMSKRKIVVIILAFVALIAIVAGGAYGIYIMTSNHVTGTPQAKATLTLTANTTGIVVGDTLHLVAHVSDNTAGITINVTNNSVQVGTAVTDSNGNAAIDAADITSAYDFVATGAHP